MGVKFEVIIGVLHLDGCKTLHNGIPHYCFHWSIVLSMRPVLLEATRRSCFNCCGYHGQPLFHAQELF